MKSGIAGGNRRSLCGGLLVINCASFGLFLMGGTRRADTRGTPPTLIEKVSWFRFGGTGSAGLFDSSCQVLARSGQAWSISVKNGPKW